MTDLDKASTVLRVMLARERFDLATDHAHENYEHCERILRFAEQRLERRNYKEAAYRIGWVEHYLAKLTPD